MNIVLCADDNYVMACGVCITSIFENNKDINCNVYIFTEGFTTNNEKILYSIGRKYNQNIIIKIIDTYLFANLKVSSRFRKSIYFRFLIPTVLEDESIALYLDCDVIVDGSIKGLQDICIDNYACAVIEDQSGDDIRNHNRINIYNSSYFNSGVLLINLDYWRQYDISDKCISFIYENPEICLFPDQDALNVILHGKVKFISYKYNFQALFYVDDKDKLLHRKKWNEINMCSKNPIIIHYSCDIKPWFHECKHPKVERFLYYKELSPFKNTKEQYIIPIRKRRIMKCKYLIKKMIKYTTLGIIKL